MKENAFQTELVKDLYRLFPNCIVVKNDPNYVQGIPDLTIYHNNKWACLECKKSKQEPYQPNQEYYIDRMNQMSFASVICPENKQEVLNELQRAFSSRRTTRIPKCE